MRTSRIKNFILTALLYIGVAEGKAVDTIPKPIRDYLHPILATEVDKQGNSLEWEATGNGGYLIRQFMDVDGDGNPELFLTSTLSTFGHQHYWKVFRISNDGQLQPYNQIVCFFSGEIWIDKTHDRTRVVSLAPASKEDQMNLAPEDWKYPLYGFEFHYPNVIQSSVNILDAEAEKLRPSPVPKLPEFESVLLADYLTNPNAPWITLDDWKVNAHGYFMRTEDAERVSRNTAFTPQIALAKLDGVETPPIPPQQAPAETSPPPQDHPTHPTPPETPASKDKPLTTEAPDIRWHLVVIALGAGIAAFLTVRKRL